MDVNLRSQRKLILAALTAHHTPSVTSHNSILYSNMAFFTNQYLSLWVFTHLPRGNQASLLNRTSAGPQHPRGQHTKVQSCFSPQLSHTDAKCKVFVAYRFAAKTEPSIFLQTSPIQHSLLITSSISACLMHVPLPHKIEPAPLTHFTYLQIVSLYGTREARKI